MAVLFTTVGIFLLRTFFGLATALYIWQDGTGLWLGSWPSLTAGPTLLSLAYFRLRKEEKQAEQEQQEWEERERAREKREVARDERDKERFEQAKSVWEGIRAWVSPKSDGSDKDPPDTTL
jgi:hypothetical protein